MIKSQQKRRLLQGLLAAICCFSQVFPAVAQEAVYCGMEEHEHGPEFYAATMLCGEEEGETHHHTEDCQGTELQCQKAVHVHSLSCHSNPDLSETPADWEASLPGRTQDPRQDFIAIAKSQIGTKEQEGNFEVQADGTTVSWIRYGVFKNDPYQKDWDWSFMEFCAFYAGIPLPGNLEQIEKEKARAGDLVKANGTWGIITDVRDGVFDIVTKVNSQVGVIQTESPALLVRLPLDGEIQEDGEPKENAGQDDQQNREFDKNETTLSCQTSDGTTVIATFDKGVLPDQSQLQVEPFPVDSPNYITFQTQAENFYQKNGTVKPELELRAFNIQFIVQNMEVEPTGPVTIHMKFADGIENPDLLHFKDGNEVEKLEIKECGPKELEFESGSFSVYALAYNNGPVEINDYCTLKTSVEDEHGPETILLTGNVDSKSWTGILENGQDISDRKTILVNRTVTICLNGYAIQHSHGGNADNQSVFRIREGGHLILENGTTPTDAGTTEAQGWNFNDGGTQTVAFQEDKEPATWTSKSGIGVVHSAVGDAISLENSGILEANNIALPGSTNGSAIHAEGNTKIALTNCILVKNRQGIETHGGSLAIRGGAITSHEAFPATFLRESTEPDGLRMEYGGGAAIRAEDAQVTISKNTIIVRNSTLAGSESNHISHGGAICLYGHTKATFTNCSISYNQITASDHANGGAIAVLGSACLTLGSGSKVLHNTAQTSGGGISVHGDAFTHLAVTAEDYEKTARLYLAGGEVAYNQVYDNEGGGISLNTGHANYIYLCSGSIHNNKTHQANTSDHWGGGGLFVGECCVAIVPNGMSVYDNQTHSQGGGIAASPTGHLVMDASITITRNKAEGFPWTIPDGSAGSAGNYQTGSNAQDVFSCNSSTVAGNAGPYGAGWVGESDGAAVQNANSGSLSCTRLMGLTSVTDNQAAAIALHSNMAVYGNESYIHGGGIMVSGYLITNGVSQFDTGDAWRLEAKKQLINGQGEPLDLRNETFDFTISDNPDLKAESTNILANGSMDRKGNITFPVLNIQSQTTTVYLQEKPGTDTDTCRYDPSLYKLQINAHGTSSPTFVAENASGAVSTIQTYTWTLEENNPVTVWKWNPDSARFEDFSRYGSTKENAHLLSIQLGQPFVNTKILTRTITVRKEWVVDGNTTTTVPNRVKAKNVVFTLTSDDGVIHPEKTLTENGTVTWKNLPIYNNGTEIQYTVDEKPLSGWEKQVGNLQETEPQTNLPDRFWEPATSLKAGTSYILVSDNKTIKQGNYNDGGGNGWRFDRQDLLTSLTPLDPSLGYEGAVTGTDLETFTWENGTLQSSTNPGQYLAWVQDGENAVLILTGNQENRGAAALDKTGTLNLDGKPLYLVDGRFQSKPGSDNQKVRLYELTDISGFGNSSIESVVTVTNTKVFQNIGGLLVVVRDSKQWDKTIPDTWFHLTKDGAVLRFIKGEDGIYYPSEEGEETLISDAEGMIEVEDLAPGQYNVIQTRANDAYQMPDTTGYGIWINPNQQYRQDVTNAKKPYTLPGTGSAGSDHYRTGGLLLAVVSLVLFQEKKKRNTQ